MEAAPYLSARAIVRIVLIIVGVVLALYLIYLLRKPLTWLFIALFLAVALSPPVNYLNRYMKRGFAIGLVYLAMFGIIITLAALLIPPIVNQIADVADNAPRYAQDVQDYVHKKYSCASGGWLRHHHTLEDEAGGYPSRIGGAAGTLRDIGLTLVNGPSRWS
jgi:predicted PurR-regulated permease PerM